MNPWRSRLLTALLFLAVMKLHEYLAEWMPNTPCGMLVFHGSAALFDLILLLCVPYFVEGRLCDDMQTLCLASMIVNFVGWILYMAYAPPIFYNSVQWGLAYVQWLRLFLVDRDDSHPLGLHLVRGGHHGRSKLHFGKEAP